ncbi:MAG: ATP-binding protein [Pyrinomonadaceae bacterium]
MVDQQQTQEQIEPLPEPKPRRPFAPWFFGGMVLVLLSVLMSLQVLGVWTVVQPDTASDTLVLYAVSSLTFMAFIIFSFIFVRSLLRLRQERVTKQLGSKIKTRLVVYFITVSLLPITAMAIFSFIFLNRSLEKWFGRLPEDVVNTSREAMVEDRRSDLKSLHETAAMVAETIRADQALISENSLTAAKPQAKTNDGQADQMAVELQRLRSQLPVLSARGGIELIRIISSVGEVIAEGTGVPLSQELQGTINHDITIAFGRGITDTENWLKDTERWRDLNWDVAVAAIGDGRSLILVRQHQPNPLLGEVVSGAGTYNQLRLQQRKIRLTGLSTLALLTLLLLFASTWTALHLARGIATPIKSLAEAAGEVARGNLAHRVSTIAHDELALLAIAFNQMTTELEENRRRLEANAAELQEKNLALEERRGYIEKVLESLSTGVISLDEHDNVTTINAAALQMLMLKDAPAPGTPLSNLISREDIFIFDRLTLRARRSGHSSEQADLIRATHSFATEQVEQVVPVEQVEEEGLQTIPVALAASSLHPVIGLRSGVVVVMEDLSDLQAAQRAAAWSEVARRMAHEIKNPLTPIQLSAERIARTYNRMQTHELLTSNGGDRVPLASVIEECTETIKREVSALKAMVDEFSRFARLPHARLELADLNEIVRQTVALYEDRLDGVRLNLLLTESLPPAMLDGVQLRRVFVNLIDNALEAVSEVTSEKQITEKRIMEKRITIATAYNPARNALVAEVTDTGHGIPQTDFRHLFEPYFSTRERGTGLGLAIVKRIIGDHNGRIRAGSNHPHGAKFIVELPAADESTRPGENTNGQYRPQY